MHSVEGGAIFVNDASAKVDEFGDQVSPLRYKVNRLRNFGHFGPEVFDGVGINAKNSEMHAAIGLVNLRYADEIMADRARQHEMYNEALSALELVTPKVADHVRWNKSYYPVVFRDEIEALYVKDGLEESGILPVVTSIQPSTHCHISSSLAIRRMPLKFHLPSFVYHYTLVWKMKLLSTSVLRW